MSKLECTVENQRFCLSNVSKDESKLCFYTGFTSFTALMACYNFLGPAVNSLLYSHKEKESTNKRCRPRSLSPEDDFFLVLVRLRLGLMEQDLAYRFDIFLV